MKMRTVSALSLALVFSGLVAAVFSCGEDEWGDGTGGGPNPRDREDAGGDTDAGGQNCPPDCPPAEMVSVPAAAFEMGCNGAVDTECGLNEGPYHGVSVPAFQIDKYEVTAGEFKGCVAAGACTEPTVENPACTYTEEKSRNPVTCVTWRQAKAYCIWAGKRLPTEAEWELAARGTDGRKYPWGNEPLPDCSRAVMRVSMQEVEGCGTGGTMPVGSMPAGAGPFGAMDMVGNAWEFVEDGYHEDYTGAPTDGSAWLSGAGKVVRGGGFDNAASSLRTSARESGAEEGWMINTGFRCAK
jgi:formylglycine-generating enzyme required for sulfatase activity